MNYARTRSLLALVAALVVAPSATFAQTSSYSARSVDIYDALRLYAQHAGISLYIDDSVAHKQISFRMLDINDRTAFDALLDANGLAAITRSGITYVATPNVLSIKYGANNLSTATLPVTGALPSALTTQLAPLLPPGTVLFPDDTRGVLIVKGTPEALTQARTYLGLPLTGNRPNAYDLQTVSFAMNYASANNALAQLQSAVPAAGANTATIQTNTNSIVLHGTPTYISNATRALTLIDAPSRQVLYTASIIELQPDIFEQNFGTQWGGVNANGQITPGSASTVWTFQSKYIPISTQINFLVQNGQARVLERPTILATNGTAASTTIGTDYPIVVQDPITGIGTVRTITAGVTLNVTPTIGNSVLTTKVNTTYSNIIGTSTDGYPILARRSLDSIVMTHPDDVILIGGLYALTDNQNITKVPYIGDIPVIGGIFKNKTQNKTHNEIVILLQPHLQDVDHHDIPVAFPAISNDLIQHGLYPAPLTAPSSAPAPAVLPLSAPSSAPR